MLLRLPVWKLHSVGDIVGRNGRDSSVSDEVDTVVEELVFGELGDSFGVLWAVSDY